MSRPRHLCGMGSTGGDVSRNIRVGRGQGNGREKIFVCVPRAGPGLRIPGISGVAGPCKASVCMADEARLQLLQPPGSSGYGLSCGHQLKV